MSRKRSRNGSGRDGAGAKPKCESATPTPSSGSDDACGRGSEDEVDPRLLLRFFASFGHLRAEEKHCLGNFLLREAQLGGFRSSDADSEGACDPTKSNQWLHLGVSRLEVAILKAFVERNEVRRMWPVSQVARLLLMWALANLERLEPELRDLLRNPAEWCDLVPRTWKLSMRGRSRAVQSLQRVPRKAVAAN